jgi:hypothetical protein
MMIVVQPDAPALLGQEDIYITVGRITMELALDVVTKSFMAVAQCHGLCTEIIVEATS